MTVPVLNNGDVIINNGPSTLDTGALSSLPVNTGRVDGPSS